MCLSNKSEVFPINVILWEDLFFSLTRFSPVFHCDTPWKSWINLVYLAAHYVVETTSPFSMTSSYQMNNLTEENIKIMDDSKGKKKFQVILEFSADRCFFQSDLRIALAKVL